MKNIIQAKKLKIFIFILFSVFLCAAVKSWPQSSDNFPAVGVFGIRNMKAARDLGIEWTRSPLRWSWIEPSRGNFKWKKLEEALQLPLTYVITLRFEADWATNCRRKDASCFPESEQDLRNFVSQVVRRCKGKVVYWQIENEPYASPAFNTYWDDSMENLVKLTKIAAQEIRKIDPSARIILAGIPAGRDDRGRTIFEVDTIRKNILTVMEKAKDYFDVVDIHLYGKTDLIPKKIAQLKELMAQTGNSHKLIFSTENSIEFLRPVPTRQEQAQDIAKRFSLTYANGVSLALYFLYRDSPTDRGTQVLGLLDSSGNPKPAYYAFRQFTDKTAGFTKVSKIAGPSGVSIYAYTTARGTVYLAWAQSPGWFDLSGVIVYPEIIWEEVAMTAEGGNKKRLSVTRVPLSSVPVFLTEQ